ncbi:serine protease [Amycolatopsis sp. NPDC004169]|uniref:S1 family peptidase n=1 Tax=Amycolatopsis sp. NPDC004169 TaxID=3154453 RepID=UPI00339DFCA3
MGEGLKPAVRSLATRHRDNLIEATVRVLAVDPDGRTPSIGTGFFVAPGKVVTCAHVVPAGRRYVVQYRGEEYDATLLVREPDTGAEANFAYPDVALLSVDVADCAVIPVGSTFPEAGRELYAYGCPLIVRLPVWDHLDLVSEGQRVRDGTTDVFVKTKGSQVQPGASGAGTIDLRTGELVGMLAQTRDAKLDLGGALIPAGTILDVLAAAGHDVRAANQEAAADVVTLAGARRRLKWVLQLLAVDLDDAGPVVWRSMLMALDNSPPEGLAADEAALALLNIDLEDLGNALEELARATRSPAKPIRLLSGAASFAWYAKRPLVEPDTAIQLARERACEEPRVVHLPAACDLTVKLHAGRAAVDQHWEVIPVSIVDAETDAETGLPRRLVTAARWSLLDRDGVLVDEDDPDSIDAAWAQSGAQVRARIGRRLLLVLPATIADTGLVEALRREFAPCMFALAGRSLSAALRRNSALLELSPSLDDVTELAADVRYRQITRKIERASNR